MISRLSSARKEDDHLCELPRCIATVPTPSSLQLTIDGHTVAAYVYCVYTSSDLSRGVELGTHEVSVLMSACKLVLAPLLV